MNPAMLVNGEPTDQVAADDRGLQYGDGLFETMAVVNGRLPLWRFHMERLAQGCRRLRLPAPDTAGLQAEVEGLAQGVQRAVIKLIISRGPGGRGYRPPATPTPTRILKRAPWPDYPAQWWREGVAVRECETRLGNQPALAGIKHLNRLEQVMARAEWDDPDIAEGLMLDADGRVIEGTVTNLFIVRDGRLLTPDLSRAGVAGVMRRCVMELARERQWPVAEADLDRQAVAASDEMFLTNSLIGIWPVRAWAGRGFKPGPMTRDLQALLAERVFDGVEG